ncbi:sensor histidine kinase [Dyadobacter arcticus]|uniref:histidine kinase n=1 Tax=Dyadobacter arcticus TaxID=1078754 RepID=A0ABX0UM60_9BACT|nr:ATP-binding protein [Dyadobacter arcticus]NIJ52765.1 signal transduction histidine kinase [Dyadobacter arcticus]
MKRLLFEKGYFWKLLGFEGLDEEEFKKRTTAVQLALYSALGGIIFCIVYLFLGFPNVVYAVAVYVVVSQLNLLYLRITHNYDKFGFIQLVLILLFPMSTQLTIGGYIEAGAVILAAFYAPAGALLYARKNIARLCFYIFILEIIGAACWEYFYGKPQHTLPRSIILMSFASNIILIFVILYALLESFLKKQQELRTELRESLTNLRTTQSQLIQAEKMASLGQLTAGIAHEIQNPLNFVNNFSELNTELTQEIQEEMSKPDADSVIIKELIRDLFDNQQKIVHHGQRASAIIKGMLEHSRSGTGQHELTDINHLAEEFLHLAYHGQRAKDSTFNARLVTSFAADMPKIKTISQDLGRVILNLLNNAFYATKKKTLSNVKDYNPTVWLSTAVAGNKVKISIKDNGTGIPEDVVKNIFQPFFTTKPTGEGTGLGLSLSYDIITGSHNGTIEVESVVGEGTEFVVTLPIRR